MFAIFLIFAQNILWVHVRTALPSTHNLCFEAKIRKIGILHTPVLLYKSRVRGGLVSDEPQCKILDVVIILTDEQNAGD